MRKTIGVLAHVDAGKTTFSERVLYLTHAIRTLGRVDHQDAFLDMHPLERQRGITIFSGQATFTLHGDTIYWLDTPGHVDFSTEMERAIRMMDYAVLLVSCAEGVQSHTETVWQLLKAYQVPVFIFINKIDRAGAEPERVLAQLKRRLSSDCIDLRCLQMQGVMDEALQEAVAERDEALMNRLFDSGYEPETWMSALREQIRRRACFPVMAGAALDGCGVAEFLSLLSSLTVTDYEQHVSEPLTARCWQVRHERETRLCYLKLLTGCIRIKDELPGQRKVNELRIAHGGKYHSITQAQAGDLVVIPCLDGIAPGDMLGVPEHTPLHTEPMMSADILWDEKAVPAFRMRQALSQLEEEEPSLSVTETGNRMAIHVMGPIQLEVLRQLLMERYGYAVSFGPASVLYKETIAAPSIGVGHYEPLRHYAECHLRLVPGERGSGITFQSLCHVDVLALNWQRLIRTHVFERVHKGVLTGAPLTDVRVELLTGRAHLKHTEGGDFRQAVYRAIRNALMYAQNVLLEPIAGFELRAPATLYGTLTGALNRMQANVEPPQYEGEDVIVCGEVPYAVFIPWQESFMALTHGCGALRVWMSHYAPCSHQEEIVAQASYQPLADDTPDSVFCSHGAGFTVPWNEVRQYMHMSHEEFLHTDPDEE